MDMLTEQALHRIQNLSHDALRGAKHGDPAPRTGFLGLTHREVRDYSLSRALHQRFFDPEGLSSGSLEMECDVSLTRVFHHRNFKHSLLVPGDVLYRGMDTQPGAKGGYAVGNSVGGFIDTLRAVSLLKRLGARGLSGAKDNLTFPRRTSGAAVQWLTPGVPPLKTHRPSVRC